jgi:hypothetical protein
MSPKFSKSWQKMDWPYEASRKTASQKTGIITKNNNGKNKKSLLIIDSITFENKKNHAAYSI